MNLCGLNKKAFGVGEGMFLPLFIWESKRGNQQICGILCP